MTATPKQIAFYECLRDTITACEESGDSGRIPEKRRTEAKMNDLIRECPTVIQDWSAVMLERTGY
jgi:RecB family endonuclease NucS